MARQAALPVGFLAVICGLVCSAPCGAQFPEVPTRCWRPPPGQKLIVTWRKVFIKDVNFDGPIHVPRSDIEQIIQEGKKSGFGPTGSRRGGGGSAPSHGVVRAGW